MNVISLVPPEKREQCPVCTARLLEVFQELQSGGMVDIAIAWTTTEGSIKTSYSSDTPLIAGAVAVLLHRVSES